MKLASIFFLMVFSPFVLSCCFSPLGEFAFEATLDKVRTEATKDGKHWECLVRFTKQKNLFGEAPSVFESKLSGQCKNQIDESKSYVLVLYDRSKHGSNGKYLTSNNSQQPKLKIHKPIGIHEVGSEQANFIEKTIKENGDMQWSKDFGFIRVNFLEKSITSASN